MKTELLVRPPFRYICKLFAAIALLTSTAIPALAENKFYVNADAGLNFINAERWQLTGFKNIDAPFRTGYRIDGAFGYELTKKWNVEVELGIAENKASNPDQFLAEQLNFYQFPILLNAIYRPNWSPKIKPFLAAGAGATIGQLQFKGVSYANDSFYDRGAVSPAAQFKAGFELPVTRSLNVQLTYKALLTTGYDWGNLENFDSTLHSGIALNQSVTFGFRLHF